jgi:carboxyl-terminal processing protease
VYAEILSNVGEAQVKVGRASDWEAVNSLLLEQRWPLYYPGYQLINELNDISVDHKFTVRFSEGINWQTVGDDTVELINSSTGERIPVNFDPLNATDLRVSPQTALKTASTYWLLVHPTVCNLDNKPLKNGAICTATVIPSEVTSPTK